jgi:hypothetical protein
MLSIHDRFTDVDDIFEALFGQTVGVIDSAGARFARRPDGSWFGPDGYQKRRIRALCLSFGLRPDNLSLKNPVLWHYPYPKYSISPSLWKLPQKVVDYEARHYKLVSDASVWELLSIDPNKLPK